MTRKVDMLHGPLARPMIAFALPLIASGILQQSFNSVDVAIAGRFAGSDALAAVGVNGPVIGLIVNMFIGLAVGVNVVVARCVGQRNSEGVRSAVTASAQLAVVGGLALMCITLAVARPILELLGTPNSVLEQAVLYLRLYALSMPFMVIFNFGAAILRSVGDTRRPFYCLVGAGCVNVALNIVFVASMGMGVAGVAWGTVIASIVNAVAITVILLRETGDTRLDVASLLRRPCRTPLVKIAAIGLPAGIQGTVFAFSNVFIVSAINTFGADGAAGSAAAINFELYCYFVINAFGQTAVAFTSQNYGAGQPERCRRIFRLSLAMSFAAAAILNIALVLARHQVIGIFTTDEAVVPYAAQRMLSVLLFQSIACYYEMAGSSMRGLGYSMTPALITIFGTCVLRLAWVATFHSYDASFSHLMMVYPASWALTDVAMWIAYRKICKRVYKKI